MIICLNCSPEIKNKMDKMLNSRKYSDYSELFAVAIENLWVLDEQLGSKASLVIGDLSRSESPLNPQQSTTSRRSNKSARSNSGPQAAQLHVPPLFSESGLEALNPSTIEAPPSRQVNQQFTLDEWIFGQYNRLLPAKANCRALMRITAEQQQGASFETDALKIAREAAVLGDYLTQHDMRNQSIRDEALATAFPRTGDNADKSCARYANHFIGSVNSKGVPSGLLCAYSLAGLSSDSHRGEGKSLQPRLLLSPQGVRFARLTNPILDNPENVAGHKFCAQERAFLLDHIKSFVPAEAFAFRALIKAINEGNDNPDKLDGALRAFVPALSDHSLSKSYLTSQRSGALSRMTDLGLIERERNGVRVSYIVTPDGEAFLYNRINHNCGEDK